MAFRCLPLLFLLTLSSWGVLADDMSGEQVYGKVCISCHGSQFPRAPQLGDTKACKPLLREGQKIGCVVSDDLRIAAQAEPGRTSLRFEAVSINAL